MFDSKIDEIMPILQACCCKVKPDAYILTYLDDLINGGKSVEFYQQETNYLSINNALDKIFENLNLQEIRHLAAEIVRFHLQQDNEALHFSSVVGNVVAAKLGLKHDSGDIIYFFGRDISPFVFDIANVQLDRNLIWKDIFAMSENEQEITPANTLIKDLLMCKHTSYIEKASLLETEPLIPYSKAFLLPPFNKRACNGSEEIPSLICDYKFNYKNNAEWLYIDRMLGYSLKNGNCKFVACIPNNLMHNGTDEEYRNILINKGFIVTTELITDKLASTFNYKGELMFITLTWPTNKEKQNLKHPHNYEPMNENDYEDDEAFKEVVDSLFDDVDFESSPNIDDKFKDLAKKVDPIADEYLKNDPNRLTLDDVALVFRGSGYTLKNFANRRSEKNTNYKVLFASDLQDGLIDVSKLNSISEILPKERKFILEDGDILLTSKSTILKTAYVDLKNDPNTKIIAAGGVIVIRKRKNALYEPLMIKAYLDSSEGRYKLNKIAKGSKIFMINVDDLKPINIPEYFKEYQEETSKKLYDQLNKIKTKKLEIEKIKESIKELLDDM